MDMKISLVIALLLMMTAAHAAYFTDSPVVVISKVRQDDNPAVPGKVVKLLLQVENQGAGRVDDLEMTLVPTYPLSMYGGESPTKQLGSLAGYQDEGDSLQVSYDLYVDPLAASENVQLDIRYNYSDAGAGNEGWYSTVTIDVPVDNPSVGFQTAGKMVSEDLVELFITNVGKNTARSVLAYVDGGNVYSIGDLKTGNLSTVYVSLPEGVGPGDVLEMKFEYTDSLGARRTSTDFAPIYSGSVQDIQVDLQDFSSSTLTLAVVNTGNFPLYAVSVGLGLPGSTESIIGNLEAGDYSLATFTMPQFNSTMPDSAAPGQFNSTQRFGSRTSGITATVSYTDMLGERRVSEQEIQLSGSGSRTAATTFSTRSSRTSNGSSSYLLIGLGGLAILGGAFWLLRKRRGKKR